MYIGLSTLITATLCYTVSHSLVKVLAGQFTIYQLAFVRFIGVPLMCLPILGLRKHAIEISNWPLLCLRIFFGITGMILFFLSLHLGDPGRVALLFQCSSIWSFLLGVLLFKERVSRWGIASLPLALLGLLLLVTPNFDTSISLADGLALLASFSNTGVYLCLKQLRKHHTTTSIMITSYGLSAMILTVPALTEPIQEISMLFFGLLVCISVVGFLGNWLMTYGLKHVHAGTGSMIMILTVPFMAVSGALFFNEGFSLLDSIAAGLILIALVGITKYGYIKEKVEKVSESSAIKVPE